MKHNMIRAFTCASLLLVLAALQMPVTRAQTAPVVPKSRNDRWMADMAAAYPRYGELRLAQALFPGAHDAGSYELNAVFSPDIPALFGLQFSGLPLAVLVPTIMGWSETQHDDFTGQLNGGVRYFDLRLCAPIFVGGPVRFCHGLYGPTLEDGLTQIAAFAAQPAHSKEILIVHVAAWYGFSDTLKASTKALIKTKLGDRMFPEPAFDYYNNYGASVWLEEVWRSGKSIIVLADAGGDDFWNTDRMVNPWPGELDIKTDRHDLTWWQETVVANLACRCDSQAATPTAAASEKFFGLQIQATPSVFDEISVPAYSAAYPFNNLDGLSAVTNPLIMPQVLDRAHDNLNVVLTDFATEHGFVEAIKNLTIAKLDLLEGKVSGRAYLSRTESTITGPGVLTTSANGTYFGYAMRIRDNDFAGLIYPAVAHFGSSLFAGDLRVTSIADDFMKTTRTWGNGTGFDVNLNPVGLPESLPSLPASYGEAYGRFYVAWTDLQSKMHVRSSPDGQSFAAGDSHALPATSPSVPVLANRRGKLYIAWMDTGRSLQYGRIEADGTFVGLGTLAGNLLARPAMTGYNDRLLFSWPDSTDRKIRVLVVDPVSGLTSLVSVLAQETTDASTSLAVFKGSVVLAYTGRDRVRYTLVSADGETFSSANRTSQVPALSSTLAPPTLHAWGDRAIVTVHGTNADGTTYTPGTWTRQNVTVTFGCTAPVAGRVLGFLADTGAAEPEFFAGDSISSTLSGSGQQLANVSCVDLAGHAVAADATVKIDRTPPVITYLSSTPSMPASGWFKTNVVAKFTCSDADSGPVEEVVQVTLATEGVGQRASGTCVDRAGNTATAISSDIFNIDKTAPTIVSERVTPPNAHGWNNEPFMVKYVISDGLSGVSGPSVAGVAFTSDGRNQHRLVTVTDIAGNSAQREVTEGIAPVNIDSVRPQLSTVSSFSRFMDGPGPFAVSYSAPTASDVNPDGSAGSGLAADGVICHPASGANLFKEGANTVTCGAADLAGNVGSTSFIVTIIVNKTPVISGVTASPIDEGSTATIAVAASDPDGDALTYALDCDGDGTFETAPTAGSTASCAFNDSGDHAVSIRVTDARGATAAATTLVTVNNVAPSATFTNNGPVDEGATFTLSMTNATDPSPADTSAGFQYAFDCGSGYGAFAASSTTTCQAGTPGVVSARGKVRDKDGGAREYSATVTVRDITPPSLTVSDVVAEATGPNGAAAAFAATATDAIDPRPAVGCSRDLVLPDGQVITTGVVSGATFPLGSTAVSCTATDASGNNGRASFTVTVRDTTPPALTVPSNMTVPGTGATTVVTFAASAADIVDGAGVPVTCSPASGAAFPVGTTPVNCSATDKHGNTSALRSFTVTVVDQTAPVLNVPASLTVDGKDAPGVVVTFPASANDAVDGAVSVTCSPASGAVFPLGATPVRCAARDRAGNPASADFIVIVRDTVAPAVTYTGNAGTYAVDQMVNIRCTATDGGSGVASTTCADISGPAYSFKLGLNTYSAKATDRAGNTGGGATSFTLTVPAASLQALVSTLCTNAAVADGLNAKLAAAAKAPNANARAGQLGAFENQVRAQTGKALTKEQADTLLRLVAALY